MMNDLIKAETCRPADKCWEKYRKIEVVVGGYGLAGLPAIVSAFLGSVK